MNRYDPARYRALGDALGDLDAAAGADRLTACLDVLTLIGNIGDLTADLTAARSAAAAELRRHGYTARQIAKAAGVTPSAISQLLPPVDDLEALRIRHATPRTATIA